MAPPDTPLYAVRRLHKQYVSGSGATTALRGIDLDLYAGELVVILGPSGSGKSSLLNALGGLDRPSAGTIRFRELVLTDLDERALAAYRRAHVGFVFQSYNLIASLTARENVALGSVGAKAVLAPEIALDLVGLGAGLDRFPAQLSGGEQQRVAVARAVAKRPDVLLCDEPTGALDRANGVRVLEAIERVQRMFGTLAVLITHNTVIADMADRVLTLADGRCAGTRANGARRPVQELSW